MDRIGAHRGDAETPKWWGPQCLTKAEFDMMASKSQAEEIFV